MKNSIPVHVREIADILSENHHEAYLVGGCVRDLIMNTTPRDYDFTTEARPDTVMKIFKGLGYLVVPIGIQHGTVTVFIDGIGYEITTFRAESTYSDKRHPDEVVFSNTLEEDLIRRDFTINAIAYDVINNRIIDPMNGQADIRDKVIRTIGDPDIRFNEDALRLIRAIRFSVKLGFQIEQDTYEALIRQFAGIRFISKERINDELSQILLTGKPEYGIRLLKDTGLLAEILPEIDRLDTVEQNNPFHIFNVFDHTMKSLSASVRDLSVRLAVLLHDTGKADTRTTDEEGVDHFIGHAEKSEEITRNVLNRLRFDGKTVAEVTKLVLYHDEQFPRTIGRFKGKLRDMNVDIEKLLQVKTADVAGQNPDTSYDKMEEIGRIRDTYNKVIYEKQPYLLSHLTVNGKDILNRIPQMQGKLIGSTLQYLLEQAIANPAVNNPDKLLELAERYFSRSPGMNIGDKGPIPGKGLRL
ncbi:MAG: CCA tRNA nucleotidyltransferase [Brevinematales bacterium]|nr:CCA tRNA nucleotidyltransferase [Brevinematales bacterium]